MLYPRRFQVRHSTVLVIVLLLMGSVLYEVTRTESVGRQSAARTQDISLPAPQPVEHRIAGNVRPDYIGRTSVFSRSKPITFDGDVATAVGSTGAAGIGPRSDSRSSGASAGAPYGRAVGQRVRSANSSGYAQGGYGMSGVGAWGGVSGMMRISERSATAPKAAKEPKAAKPVKEAKPKRPGNSGGATTGTSGDAQLAGGFTTGAAAVVPGAVVAVQTPGAQVSPGSSPASTPEPMSVLLMGSGLVALYGARRRLS